MFPNFRPRSWIWTNTCSNITDEKSILLNYNDDSFRYLCKCCYNTLKFKKWILYDKNCGQCLYKDMNWSVKYYAFTYWKNPSYTVDLLKFLWTSYFSNVTATIYKNSLTFTAWLVYTNTHEYIVFSYGRWESIVTKYNISRLKTLVSLVQ